MYFLLWWEHVHVQLIVLIACDRRNATLIRVAPSRVADVSAYVFKQLLPRDWRHNISVAGVRSLPVIIDVAHEGPARCQKTGETAEARLTPPL